EANEYLWWLGSITVASGINGIAWLIGIAEWIPRARQSYEADSTTLRPPGKPTITGLPTSSGRARSSTETKKASMSTCKMARSVISTHLLPVLLLTTLLEYMFGLRVAPRYGLHLIPLAQNTGRV